MAVFYLDTSALVKRYRKERGTEVIVELLENPGGDDRFYISFLSILELTSGVMRLVTGGELREGTAKEILARFRYDIREIFRVWPLDQDVVGRAVSVVEEHNLRSADAIHLATALSIHDAAPAAQLLLVSSDRELLQATLHSSISSLDPQHADARQQLTQLREARG